MVRLGKPVRVVTEPGLHFKVPLIDSVIDIDKRILDLGTPAQEVIASDQKRLVVDAFARYRINDPLRFYQTRRLDRRRQFAARHPAQFGAAPRARRGDVHPGRARPARRADGADPRPGRSRGGRASASRSSTCASGAPTCPSRTARRSTSACRPSASARRPNSAPRAASSAQEIRAQGRPRRHRAGRRGDLEVRADPRRGRRRAKPDLRRGLQQGSGLLRLLSLDAGLRGRAARPTTRACCSSRTPISSAISTIRPASRAAGVAPPSAGRRAERPRRQRRGTGRGMSDFLAALGLVFVIEGWSSRPFRRRPSGRWRACMETPDASLRADRHRLGRRRR